MNKYKIFFLLCFTAISILYACKTTEKTSSKSKTKISNSQKLIIDGILIDANKEKLLGNYKNAIELFNMVISKDPDNSTAYYEIARINQSEKKLAQALAFAKKAAELDADNIWFQLLLAELYHDNQQFKETTKKWAEIVKAYPDNLDYYYDWANAYIYENNLSEAIKVYDQIEKRIGVTESISIQKQKIYLTQNKFEKAIAELEKLSSEFPNDTRFLAMIAEQYMSKKMYEKALVYYTKILEKTPNDKFIHISLAGYYREIKENEKSFQELKKGFENKDLEIDTKIQILLSYYSITEKFTELKSQAFELTEILTKTHPNDAKAFSILGDFLYREKKYAEARDAFRKVNSIDSSKYEVWETLLIIESELNDTFALIDESERAIQIFPEQPLLYLFSGISYFQANNLTKAISKLKTGVGLVVDNDKLLTQFHTYLGDIYYKKEEFSNAFKSYKSVIEIDPDNTYVLNNFTYYLSLQNEELDKAEEMGRKLNIIAPNNSSYQDTYAWVFYKLGRYEDAKKWIEKAFENGALSNDIILEHYGDIMYKLGDKEKANEYWIKAKKAGNGTSFLQKKIDEKKLYE